jgi:hypothetical protein
MSVGGYKMNIFGCGRDTSFDFLDRRCSSEEWERRRLHELHVQTANEERRNAEREMRAHIAREIRYAKMEIEESFHPNHRVFSSVSEREAWQKEQYKILNKQKTFAESINKRYSRIHHPPLSAIIQYYGNDLSLVEDWINRPLTQRQFPIWSWYTKINMVGELEYKQWMEGDMRNKWLNKTHLDDSGNNIKPFSITLTKQTYSTDEMHCLVDKSNQQLFKSRQLARLWSRTNGGKVVDLGKPKELRWAVVK